MAKGRAQSKARTPVAKASVAEPSAPPAQPIKPRILGFGEPAPFFVAQSDIRKAFHLSSMAGRWVVLFVLGSLSNAQVKAAHDAALARVALFDDANVTFIGIAARRDEALKSKPVGYRYIFDEDLAVSRRFGATDGQSFMPLVYLLDRALRVVKVEPVEGMATILDLAQRLAAEEALDLADRTAPVLTIPRIFETELCETLISHYQAQGGETSGFMREENGKTVLAHDPSHKRRRDVTITDETLKRAVRQRIERRLLPMIERAFGWKATQLERYLLACYGQEDVGFFAPHRDNTTAGTAHRKFAVTINLNADYDGGTLRFPEFGMRTYKPPIGGATVFGCGLLHEATPVTRGQRYAFLPFLYDEDGVKIRAANLDKVAMP